MEQNITLADFNSVCRACLSRDNLTNFVQTGLLEFFQNITSLKVEHAENLPDNICDMCVSQLNSVSLFIDRCKYSDSILRSILQEAATQDVDNDGVCDDNTYGDSDGNDIKNDEKNSLNIEVTRPRTASKLRDIKKKWWKEKKVDCLTCGEIFRNLKELRKHYQLSSDCKAKEFRCRVCSRNFTKRNKLKDHIRSHTKETPFQCKVCLKYFRFSQNLTRHKKIHEAIKPYSCEKCGKAFSRASLRDEHLRTHTGETPYVCKYCNKGFKRYSSHYVHVMRHKLMTGEISEDQKEFYEKMGCKRCGKQFSSKSALKSHELIHTGEKLFLCNICGKDFYTRGALQSHAKVHSGARPYSCPSCPKTFAQKGGLKNHVLIHTGAKPHTCTVCDKSFVQSTHLKNHMRTHSGEKPYTCSFCSKSFALNCNLKVHMRIHTGETPYRCPVCNMGFYDSSSMKKHVKVHGVDLIPKSSQLDSNVNPLCNNEVPQIVENNLSLTKL